MRTAYAPSSSRVWSGSSVFGTNADAHVLAGYIAKERVTPDDPNLWKPDPADYLKPDPAGYLKPDPADYLKPDPADYLKPDLKPDPADYLKPDPEGYLSPDPQDYLAPDAPTTVSAASLPLLLRTSWEEIVKRLGCPPREKVVKALAASGRTAESEVTAPCWEAALMRLGTVHKKQAGRRTSRPRGSLSSERPHLRRTLPHLPDCPPLHQDLPTSSPGLAPIGAATGCLCTDPTARSASGTHGDRREAGG